MFNLLSSKYGQKQRACVAGCDLKGVQVLKCKNTYKGLSSDTSKKCKDVAADHCDDGTINPGSTSKNFVNSADNSDSGSITVAQGCCMCGGGESSGGGDSGDGGKIESLNSSSCDSSDQLERLKVENNKLTTVSAVL